MVFLDLGNLSLQALSLLLGSLTKFFLSFISINLLAHYHEFCSLIGYATYCIYFVIDSE